MLGRLRGAGLGAGTFSAITMAHTPPKPYRAHRPPHPATLLQRKADPHQRAGGFRAPHAAATVAPGRPFPTLAQKPAHQAKLAQQKSPPPWASAGRPLSPIAIRHAPARSPQARAIQRMEGSPSNTPAPLPWKDRKGATFSTLGHGSTGALQRISFSDGGPDYALKAAPVVRSPRVLQSDFHHVVANGRAFFLQLFHGFVDERLMPQHASNFREKLLAEADKFQSRFGADVDAKAALDALKELSPLVFDITNPAALDPARVVSSWMARFNIDQKLARRFESTPWNYLATEVASGGTMASCFKHSTDFPDLLKVTVQAVAALGKAHLELGLVHNDFHPSNILINEQKASDVQVRLGNSTLTLPQTRFVPLISDLGVSFLIQNPSNQRLFAPEYWRPCGSALLASSMENVSDMKPFLAAPESRDLSTMGNTMDGTIGDQPLAAAILTNHDTQRLIAILKGGSTCEQVLLEIAEGWPELVQLA